MEVPEMIDLAPEALLGVRLRQARMAAGMTLDETAQKLGNVITKAGLSKYELNKSAPSPLLLERIAELFGVQTSYFVEEPTTHVEWLECKTTHMLGKRRE